MFELLQVFKNAKEISCWIYLANPKGRSKSFSEIEIKSNKYKKIFSIIRSCSTTSLKLLKENNSIGEGSNLDCTLYYARDLRNNIRVPFIVCEFDGRKFGLISHYYSANSNKEKNKELNKACENLEGKCEELYSALTKVNFNPIKLP